MSELSNPIRRRNVGGLEIRERTPEQPLGTLFYLHGLGESGLCFERLITEPRLASWQHVVPDLDGYGRSVWPETPPDFDSRARRLGHWLTARCDAPVVLVGHSMGGVIGSIIARAFPSCVRAFVNIEGNISLDDCTLSRDTAAFDRDAFLGGGLASVLDKVYRAGIDDPAFRGYYASLRLCDPNVLHRDSVELVALSKAEGLAKDLAKVPAPTLYVLGDPRGAGARSRQLLDDAGVAWRPIADAGHWPYLDQPETFVDKLQHFLVGLGA